MIKELLLRYLGIEVKQTPLEVAGVQVGSVGYEFSDYNVSEALKSYETNVWVNAAVGLRAESFASLEFYIKNKKTDEAIWDHPLLTLLKSPNVYLTGFEFLEYLSKHIDLTGNSFWYLNRLNNNTKGTILSISIITPDIIEPMFDKSTGVLVGWQNTTTKQKYEKENIIHFKQVCPTRTILGTSSIYSVAYDVDTDKYASQWNLQFFKNGAKPGTIITSPSTLSPEVKQNLIQSFNNAHKGADKAHKTIVMDGGLTLDKNSTTHQEMEFPLLMDKNRDRILGAFRIPKILVGQFEGGSLAEAETAIFMFNKFVTTPKAEKFCEKINATMMKEFDKTGDLELVFEKIVDEDRDFEEKKLDAGTNVWLTVNERRAIEGFEPIEGGDELRTNSFPSFNTTPTENSVEDKDVEQKTLQRLQFQKFQKDPDTYKTKYVEKFLLSHKKLEEKFTKKLAKAFNDQKKRVLDNLENKKSFNKSLASDLLNQKEEVKIFISTFTPIMLETLLTNSNTVSNIFGLGVILDASNKNVQDFITQMTVKFSTEVTNTTIDALKNALAEGLSQGDSVPELADRVKHVYSIATDSRATMIARTETTKASNGGALITYAESDVVSGKEWVATAGARDWHAEADTQKVGLLENFNVGGESIEYPGDGSAENAINCRCTVIPLIK